MSHRCAVSPHCRDSTARPVVLGERGGPGGACNPGSTPGERCHLWDTQCHLGGHRAEPGVQLGSVRVHWGSPGRGCVWGAHGWGVPGGCQG